MHELLTLVLRYARGMWRFRWAALAAAWIVAAAGGLFVYLLPERHEATAQVFVDTDNVLRPLLRGLAVETDVMSDVAVMSRTMLTRPNLEQVVRATDLDLRTKNRAEYEALLTSLEKRITIAASRENIYTITFTDTDRDMAVNVVDKLLDSFVEDTLGTGQQDSKQAEQTLGAEIKDYERRMVEAEDRLKEFKRTNVGLMPNEYGGYYEQLQQANGELAAVQQQVRIAQQKLTALDRQLEGEEPVFGIMSSPMMGGAGATPFDMQISTLEGKLANLLVEFTDKHPEVVRTKSLLDELRVQREQYVASRPLDSMPKSTNPLDINPVYQNLKIQRSTVEVELASLRAQLRDKEQQVKRLQEAVDVIPQIEAELNRLNRDYDVVKERYTAMLGRWEDLQTAQRVRTGTEEVRFRIINPPYAPLKAAGPPRALYMWGVLLVSLGAGLGLAFALNLVKPVFHATRELAVYQHRLLGSVSRSFSNAVQVQRRRGKFAVAGGFAMLLIAMALGSAFAESGSGMLRGLLQSMG